MGIVKNSLKIKRKEKMKKHNKIVMLSRSKLNSIETNLSKNLTNSGIYSSHEDSMTIVSKEKEYR